MRNVYWIPKNLETKEIERLLQKRYPHDKINIYHRAEGLDSYIVLQSKRIELKQERSFWNRFKEPKTTEQTVLSVHFCDSIQQIPSEDDVLECNANGNLLTVVLFRKLKYTKLYNTNGLLEYNLDPLKTPPNVNALSLCLDVNYPEEYRSKKVRYNWDPKQRYIFINNANGTDEMCRYMGPLIA